MLQQAGKHEAMGDALSQKKKGLKLAIMLAPDDHSEGDVERGAEMAGKIQGEKHVDPIAMQDEHGVHEDPELDDIAHLAALHGKDLDDDEMHDNNEVDKQISSLPQKGMAGKMSAMLAKSKTMKQFNK